MSALAKLGFELSEQTAWVDKTIWLGGAYMDGSVVCDDLRQMYEEIDNPKDVQRLFGVRLRGDDLKDAKDGRYPDLEEVLDQVTFRQRAGFLIQVNVGVRTYFPGGGYQAGPGYARFQWFYGATMQGALKKGQRWIEKQVAEWEAAQEAA